MTRPALKNKLQPSCDEKIRKTEEGNPLMNEGTPVRADPPRMGQKWTLGKLIPGTYWQE